MNWLSILIVVAIAVAVVFALRHMRRNKGGCSCSGCGGNCAECMRKFEEEKA